MSATLPCLWSNLAMPGSITPSLGSMSRAMRAISPGGMADSSPRAADVAAMDADMSAVLLAMPLPRGSGLDRVRFTSTSKRPKRSSVSSTARRDLGASGGASTRPRPQERCTVAVEYISTGQLTRK